MKSLFTVLFFIATTTSVAQANWSVGITAGFSPNYMVGLTGTGTSSGTPYSVNYSMNYASSMEFGADFWNTPPNSWGFISGIQIGSERSLTSGSVNGIPITTTGTVSKYQTSFLYAGTAYRWSSFYIPLGLTYGMTTFTPATPMNFEVKSGMGAILGLGWFFNENFVLEYIGRSATTELRATSGSDSETTTGVLASALLSLKYFF